ncbi:glutathione S-transferase N-terminal domain-containing protein [Pseudovibrio sp. FO-BEG1]|uniref:glutathione S-transferase N-terminal domain-containing protein n=1 Tax=Pseudovibrio sp. (strain FO-BEG1) TaxID=911045 RepID=UPI0002D8FBA3|nr:glutathione S-transferase N-terminal domain-containing protein [Pseudovibrio sp. FO-BEG1]
MKLYSFDTCPYCIRVKIMAGLKGISLDVITLSPGTIPSELKSHIASLTVPILKDEDLVLQDSSDIIHYLDQKGPPLLQNYEMSEELEAWQREVNVALNSLCYPRIPHLLPGELSSIGARGFFNTTMPKRIGRSFEDALALSDQFAAQIKARLAKVEHILTSDTLSLDSIILLADLQSLSMVAEFTLPSDLRARFDVLMKKAAILPFTKIDRHGKVQCPTEARQGEPA